jgi:hypothetical protein
LSIFGFGMTKTIFLGQTTNYVRRSFLLIPSGSRSVTWAKDTPLVCHEQHGTFAEQRRTRHAELSNFWPMAPSIGRQFFWCLDKIPVTSMIFGSGLRGQLRKWKQLTLEFAWVSHCSLRRMTWFQVQAPIELPWGLNYSCSFMFNRNLVWSFFLVFTNSPGICHRTHIYIYYIYMFRIFHRADRHPTSFRPLCRFHPMLPS